MSTTINAYSVSLGLDASNFIDSSKLSRSEVAMLKKDISAARSPMEELAVQQDRLTKALDEGAISQEVYDRILQTHIDKARKAAEADQDRERSIAQQNGLMSKLSQAGNIVSGIRDAFDMVGDAVGFAVDRFGDFNNVAEGLDATKDKAEKLGLTFNELGSLQFAAKRLGGDDAAAALDSSMGKLLKSGFVNAGESAVDAFKRAADEINGMASQTERAQRAAELFGKSGVDLLAVLQSGSSEIENLASQWERTSGLTQEQLEHIGEYNDRLEDVQMVAGGIVSIYVAEMAPALTVIINDILGMEQGLSSVRDQARFVSDTLVAMAGYAKDAYEVFNVIQSPLSADKAAAMDFSSAETMLNKVNAQRERIDNESMLKARKREEERNKSLADAKLKSEQERLDAQRKLEDDYMNGLIKDQTADMKSFDEERKREAAMSAKAIDAAEKDLERQRFEREKIRSDMAKGPQSIDAGSEAAAKFMADQINSTIAKDATGTEQVPTQEQILENSVKQYELMVEQNKKAEETNKKLTALLEEAKKNGFRRIR